MPPRLLPDIPDLTSARSMVGSLVRFEGFEITVGLREDAGERVVRGTPSAVHRILQQSCEGTEVTRFHSALAPSPVPGLRPRGWWG